MDYIFASAIRSWQSRGLTVSYDIACQWQKKLIRRIETLPPERRPNFTDRRVEFVIPKFHITAHGTSCQTQYSLNYRPYMGRTDGENIERGWAWMNPASLSTREMGPGTRQDALDDQWSFWNWQILTKLGLLSHLLSNYVLLLLRSNEFTFQGSTIEKRFIDALYNATNQRYIHNDYEKTFTKAQIKKWMAAYQAWKVDPDNNRDPFEEPESGKYF